MPTGPVRSMSIERALTACDGGAAFVDLRPPTEYLDVHIPGSLCLLYEFGPGMASRARDCLPLKVDLILLDLGYGDVGHAAASLQGKGFTVAGAVADGLNAWAGKRGTPASTEVLAAGQSPQGTMVDVLDPGARRVEGAIAIPAEHLWSRAGELKDAGRVTVIAGVGVRAALAIGILEHAGIAEVALWRPT